ncbi:tyrosine-type recombinase/integrase [Paracoccus sp. AK26]|uniref:tyrosine-type recombinase/integrase n=1 Tax=Paracoccus sp. AK26 TaxID=2589076 RepID=UPI0014287E83|nr:tyrosine-type recombinase/integrase [Paracoccus sp. AK26]QIR85042.1 phage integrase family protein [Paracoccus sp. AK26]
MRRDLKGNAVKLKHVKTITKASGTRLHYLAVPGHKMVRLPDGPKDTPEFLMAYAAAMASKKPVQGGPKHSPGSIAEALSVYQQCPAFLDLAQATREQRRRQIDKIAKTWGAAKLADLRETHIEADLAKLSGHPANSRLKVWRGFCAWAKATRRISTDPTSGVDKRATKKSDGHTPWTAADIEKFRQHWPLDTPQRLAMELLYWFGCRASDVVRLGPGMVDREGWLTFRQKKTGGEVSVPFNRALPAFARGMKTDLDMLKEAIAAAPKHMTWLVTLYGAARSHKAFSSWFAEAAAAAGVQDGKSAHGLRKARAESLAEAGATTHQIAAWTGHETLSEVQRYAKAADRRRVLSGPDEEQELETGLETGLETAIK